MKLKQKLEQEFKKITSIDLFKLAALMIIVYCGLKIFLLFYMDYLTTLMLAAVYLESQGKV